MKKLLLVLMLSFMTVGFGVHPVPVPSCSLAQAGDAIPAEGFSITMPLETGITGYWFPGDNAIAAGINFTTLRIRYADADFPTLSKIAIDLDGTVAREINAAKDTLYGIGIKANYDVDMISDTGFVFKPSLGITCLRNMEGITTAEDLLRDFRFAVYGNVILYKF